MANEMAHVDKYVLVTNEDARFDYVRSHAKKGYEYKKGANFFSTRGADGQLQSFGYDAPAAICVDGAGNLSKQIDPDGAETTSYGYNGVTQPFVVLPQLQNPAWSKGSKLPKFVSPTSVEGNPFHDMGLRGGDCVKVTDPTTGKSCWAVYGENGPTGEVGEISQPVAKALKGGVITNTSPTSGGFATMTDTNRLSQEFFPGTAERGKSGWAQKLSFDEIQKHCAAATANRSGKSGIPIVTGNQTVLVGLLQLPAAIAHPSSMHLGSCPLLTGSESVSIALSPSVRNGDDCTCGKNVVDGEPTVFVYGGKTTTTTGSGDFTLESTAFGPEPHASILPPTSAIPGFGSSGAPGIPTR